MIALMVCFVCKLQVGLREHASMCTNVRMLMCQVKAGWVQCKEAFVYAHRFACTAWDREIDRPTSLTKWGLRRVFCCDPG